MGDWKQYRRTNIAEMRPYTSGEDLSGVSVSAQDDPQTDHGMIARNPKNHADQWYVAHAYFEENFEPIESGNEADRLAQAEALLKRIDQRGHVGDQDHEDIRRLLSGGGE